VKIYDLENRLVSAVTPSSSAYYGYSGDGRRTYSYIDNNEVEYIYDGLLSLIERNGPGTYIAAYTKLPSAPGGIGGLISAHDGTNSLYYHDSNLGNVNQVTNSAGTVIQTYDYDAFGNITAQNGALTAKYAYKTKEYSPETNLIFFGARYYNPLIGRFITPDPLGMTDGPNVYLYCNNDPIDLMDMWGLVLVYANEKSKKIMEPLIENIRRQPTGKELIERLENSCEKYTIHAYAGPHGPAYRNGNDVYIDPSYHPEIETTVGIKNASTERILAHELGHFTGMKDDGPNSMNNVNGWENPIMYPTEGYNRTKY